MTRGVRAKNIFPIYRALLLSACCVSYCGCFDDSWRSRRIAQSGRKAYEDLEDIVEPGKQPFDKFMKPLTHVI